MRKAIKPRVRPDGVSFVDQEHFADGSPIHQWECTKCKKRFEKADWGDKVTDLYTVGVEVTGGFYGPNGNGFTYWCPIDEHSAVPVGNKYSAFEAFTR